MTSALSAITAAIVGVILNLAIWFALHVFCPRAGTVDWIAIVICLVALLGMLRWKWNVIAVVLGSGIAGLVVQLLIR